MSCDGLEGRKVYEAWLGCNQIQDAEDCQALSAEGIHCADWLLIDHYGLDATWQSHIKSRFVDKTACKLLVIDDLADRVHHADLLLDQNFFGLTTNERYRSFVPADCQQFLGPGYALLGPEYSQLQALVPIRTQLSRVLVFFGGVDPENFTGLTLKTLTDSKFKHLAVDVVIGSQSPHQNSINEFAINRPLTTIYNSLPSLAGLIARADLAIGAGGSTTWERACLGLPSFGIAIAANQEKSVEALNEEG